MPHISELSIVISSLLLTSIATILMINLYRKSKINTHRMLALSWVLFIVYIVLDFLPTALIIDEKYSTHFTWLARIGTVVLFIMGLLLVDTYFTFQYQEKPKRWFFYVLMAGAAAYSALTNFHVEIDNGEWVSVYYGDLGIIFPGIFGIAISFENVNLAIKSSLNLPKSKAFLGRLLILETILQLLYPLSVVLRDESVGVLAISRSAPLISISLMSLVFSYVIWKDHSVVTYNVTGLETVYLTSKDGVSGYVSYDFKQEQLLTKIEELKQIGLFTDLLAHFSVDEDQSKEINIWHQNKHIKIIKGSIFRLILISKSDNDLLNDLAKFCLNEFDSKFQQVRIEEALDQFTVEKMVNLIRDVFRFADMFPTKEFKINSTS